MNVVNPLILKKSHALFGIVVLYIILSSFYGLAQCPTQAPTPNSTSGCANASSSISVNSMAPSGGSFTPGQVVHRWYLAATGGSDQANSLGVTQFDPVTSVHVSQLTKVFSGTVSYYVSAYCGGAETPRVQVTFTATSGSNISITLTPSGVPPYNLCNQDNPTLTASGGSSSPSWEWRKDDPNGSVITSAATYAPTVSGVYYLSGYNTCNVKMQTSIPITMKNRVGTPTVSCTTCNNVCGGATTTTQVGANATDANSYSWTIANAGTSTISGTTATGTITWDPAFNGVATVKATAYGCNGSSATSAGYTITVKQPFPQPTLSLTGNSFVCPGSTASIWAQNITNAGSNPIFKWYVNNIEVSPTSATMLIMPNWTYESGAEVKCMVTNTDGCAAANTTGTSNIFKVFTSFSNAFSIVPSVAGPRCAGAGTTQFTTTPSVSSFTSDFTWSLVNGGTSTISQTGLVTWGSSSSGNVEIVVAPNSCPADQNKAKFVYSVLSAPPSLGNKNLSACDWEPIVYDPGSEYDINWYTSTDQLISTGQKFFIGNNYTPGTYTYKIETVSAAGCKAINKTTLTLTVTDQCDDRLNWTENKSYNAGGTLISNSKAFFDYTGRSLQGQSKSFASNRLFVSQSISDRYDNVVGSSLPTPLNSTSFKYFTKFLWSTDGSPYDYQDIDNPANTSTILTPNPINNTITGSTGWYYSANNTEAELVPRTQYPYSRKESYSDGTGEIKRTASAGDEHRIGKGHEVLHGTFPVYGELNDYLIKRRLAGLPDLQTDNSLFNEGVQTVVRDQNGLYAIALTDESGKTVMTARPGTSTDKVLTVANSITSSGDPASINYRSSTYFYLTTPQAVTLTGSSDFVVEDIVSEIKKAPGQTFAGGDGKWPAGFYRIILSNATSQIVLSYTSYLLDVSYLFYDDVGRLKASLSPNGYIQLASSNMYDANGNPLVDMTLSRHNFQGWLLESLEGDAGKTKYRYRKDGGIRFSQNATQFANGATPGKGKFSYTHYDSQGRPLESGEYIGTAKTFDGVAGAEVEFATQTIFPVADTKHYVRTNYDYPYKDLPGNPTIPNVPSTYMQNYVRNAVSWTENANNKTWYSYDEFGRVTWIAQKPSLLSRTFVTEYTYDLNGNVLTIKNCSYSGGNLLQPFYHHYEYDADQRLTKVYTSVDGTTKNLRGTYYYYARGPLKRIELGNKIQGIDLVYNINGWLTQINHPDKLQDPGGDGNDVFGMIIDYYESGVTSLFGSNSNFDHGIDATKYFTAYSGQTETNQPALPFMKDDLVKHLKELRDQESPGPTDN